MVYYYTVCMTGKQTIRRRTGDFDGIEPSRRRAIHPRPEVARLSALFGKICPTSNIRDGYAHIGIDRCPHVGTTALARKFTGKLQGCEVRITHTE